MLVRAPEVDVPPREAVERAVIALERRLGVSCVDTSEQGRRAYSVDESEATGTLADVVVFAHSTADIAATVAIAEAHGVPVTPRAGGTGRTGGAVPVAGGIVLATHAMNGILDIDRDNLVAVVQPGLITGTLHQAVEAEGLFYPPDPNSWASCMIGGNVAENAGGPRAFKYGVTRDYVLGLEVCLMGGRVVRTGRRTVKGVTGYDITALMVGSEGTLGVFSEVTLKLVPQPEQVATVLALFSDVRAAAFAVQRMIAAKFIPRCIELMDGLTLDAIRSQGVAVDRRAHAMLLIELDERGAARVDDDLERLGDVLHRGSGIVEILVAQDAAQRDRLWAARRTLSRATRKIAKYKISEDVVVPRSQIVNLLDEVAEIGETTGVRHLTYGHAGDGNLHVNWFWNDAEERPAVDQAIEQLMRATVRLGGTLSGEHGIGVLKAQYLPFEQSSELIEVQQNLKRVFDPKGLLNPGKIFPTGHRGC